MGCCRHSKPILKYPPLEEQSGSPRNGRRRHRSSAGKVKVKLQVVTGAEREDLGSKSSVSGSVSSLKDSSSVNINTTSYVDTSVVDESKQVLTEPCHAHPDTLERQHKKSHSNSATTTVVLADTDVESLSSDLVIARDHGSSICEDTILTDISPPCDIGSKPATPCTSKPPHVKSNTARSLVCESHLPILLEMLTSSAGKWREIGILLGFSPNELHVIESKPHLSANAPNSWLTEMLCRWVQWSPQTGHGKQATLDDLVKALQSKMVGLAVVGEEIKKAIEGAIINEQSQREDSRGTLDIACKRELKPPDESASAIERYAYYLKLYYTCNREPADKWPEIEAKKYIRLAVVGSQYGNRDDLKEFRKATIHGSIDDILQSKAPFEFTDLLEPNVVEGRKYPIRRLLLEGAPGIGKSTMSWEACRKWGNGELYHEYSLVIMLRFRDSWVQKVKSLSDMFRFPGEPEMQQEVAKHVKQTQGKGVLFVLEGFDEAPPSLRKKDSLFFELFKGSLLPNATVMVTTRPSASYDLQRCCKGESSRRIEVLGFGKKEIKEYAEAHFSQTPVSVDDFYRYLELYPHIHSMMYVPLNSAIVTHVYQMCKSTSTIVPQTMTQLYTALIKTLLLRYLKEIEEYEDVEISKFDDLPKPVLEKFSRICKLAYDGLTKPEKQIIFSGLPRDFDSLGLMQSVSELYIDKGASVSHNFLHLTIQEFLAAYHLLTLSEDKQVAFVTENFKSQSQMTKFFVGLCEQNPAPVCKAIEEKRQYTKDGKWQIYLSELHLFFELHSPHVLASVFASQSVSFYESFYAGDDSVFDFTVNGDFRQVGPPFPPPPPPPRELFDYYVLNYVILFSDCKWQIGLCNLRIKLFFEGMAMHLPRLDYLGHEYGPGANVTELVIRAENWNELGKKLELFPNLQHLCITGMLRSNVKPRLSEVLKYLPNAQTSLILPVLNMQKHIHDEEECRAVVNILSSPHHCVKHVTMKDPEPKARGRKHDKIKKSDPDLESFQHIIDGVSNTTSSVQFLEMCDLTLSSTDTASLAALLEVNTTLTKLDVCHCKLESNDIVALAKSLEVNTSLKSLDLSESQILNAHTFLAHDHETGSIATLAPSAHANALRCMLLRNKVLIRLRLVNCQLHCQDAALIAKGLENNSTLESLDLGYNTIRDDGAVALAKALEHNTTLTSLNLKHNPIDKGLAALIEALKINSTLKYFNLKGIAVSEEHEFSLEIFKPNAEGPINNRRDDTIIILTNNDARLAFDKDKAEPILQKKGFSIPVRHSNI